MPIIEPEDALGAIFGGKVKRKSNRTRKLRVKAAGVTRPSPEVMVKITGFGKGAGHISAHLTYITRNAELELETDRGDILRGKDEVKELFTGWAEEIANRPVRKNQRDTMHLVLSMPEGTPETAVRNAARAFAKKNYGANHEYVFALHTDEAHPHVHLVVRTLGFNGRRLNPHKADLQVWREEFAKEMRDQGIEAEATPRAVRGVVRKAEKSVVRHIERGDERHPPRVPRVKALRVKQAVDELVTEARGLPSVAKPWESAISTQQHAIRRGWLVVAESIEKSLPVTMEYRNERPDYEHLDAIRVNQGQRAAAVYQSNLEKHGLRASAAALARVRDLSCVNVACDERPAQVFLYSDARLRVGRHRAADNGLRWPGIGALTVARTAPGHEAGTGHGLAGTSLAEQIRQFVDNMPPIETERSELKRRLIETFVVKVDQERERPNDLAPGAQER